jgi:von Willebrand factor type A domain
VEDERLKTREEERRDEAMGGLTLAVLLAAQAGPATAPGTEVRALTVTLLDEKRDEPVAVSAADVAVIENGVARDVVSFKPDMRPLSVAILVDSSASVGSAYRLNLVDAVAGLIAELPDGAHYALWVTGDRPNKIVDYTDDRGRALVAMQHVAPQGGNYVLDALAEASADLKKVAREGDRTAVVAVTGTGIEFSYRDKHRAADEAAKNASLYLGIEIDAGGSEFEARTNVSYVLDRLARATGGLYDVVLSPMAVKASLKTAAAYLRAGYRLTYATVPDLKKRKLELKVARPGTKIVLPTGTQGER